MRLRGLAWGLAWGLACLPAWAAGTCPAIPRRSPMPMEAVPTELPWSNWPEQVAAIHDHLPGLDLPTRRLVFVGDSITAGWDPGVFGQYYGHRAPLLLGVIGDGTQGVLQRLPAEWGPMRPRLAILLIGTNNIGAGGSTPENVALGVAEIVRLIHTRSSGTRVLILGVLPRGADPSDPLRTANAKLNAIIAHCADGQTTFFLDIGSALLDPAGRLSNDVSFDFLHFTPAGYALIAAALEPEVKRIMGE